MICHVNGIDLYYEKHGSGAPLILLHGNGESHEIFDRAIPLLREKFCVYAVDTRGHGRSGAVAEYHYADMAEDIYRFIIALQLEKPVVYGFSDGGIVALLLASARSGLISRLIISGANLNPKGLQTKWLRLARFMNRREKNPRIEMMLKEPNITQSMLRKISVPTTVLAGSRDMIKRRHTQAIAAGITNSKLMILPRESHGSYIVHSEKIAELILAELS